MTQERLRRIEGQGGECPQAKAPRIETAPPRDTPRQTPQRYEIVRWSFSFRLPLPLTRYNSHLMCSALRMHDLSWRLPSGAIRKKSVCPYYTPAADERIREFQKNFRRVIRMRHFGTGTKRYLLLHFGTGFLYDKAQDRRILGCTRGLSPNNAKGNVLYPSQNDSRTTPHRASPRRARTRAAPRSCCAPCARRPPPCRTPCAARRSHSAAP